MKKTLFIILVCMIITSGLSAARSRAYTQKVVDPNSVLGNQQFPDVTCTSTQTAPGYVVNAWIVSRPTEVTSTLTHVPGVIRLYRFGNGATVPYDTRVFVQFANFATDWTVGDVLHVQVINNNVAPALNDYWEFTIPDNLTSALTITTSVALYLWPVAQNHWTYNLQVNGPAGIAVTGPGTYAGTLPQLFTTGQLLADNNDLLGSWTAGAAPAGMQWVENPITVQASDFVGAKVDHVYNAEKTFVAVPIPDTYTLNVNAVGPATPIYKDGNPTGQATNYAFNGAAAADLTGIYTLEALPAGWHWEPASFTVVAGDFTSSKSGLQVWGTMSNGAKVAYSHTITFTRTANPTTTFTLNVNGPDGYAVTGPVAGTTDYVATDSNNMVNDLVGSYTIAPVTAPSYWAVNPIVVAEGDFVANVATINFELITVNPVDPTSFPAYPAGNVTGFIVTGTGTHNLYIARQAGEIGALAYIGGAWIAPDAAPDWTWLNVNFDSKAPICIVVYGPSIVIPETPVLSISMSGTSATLSWQACTGASSYMIYCSDDPYGTYFILSTTSSLSWVCPTDNKEFFKVTAQSGRAESAPSNVVGYVKYDCVPGLNMIALPLEIPWEWVSELGSEYSSSIESIYYWNTAAQTWVGSTDLGGCWDGDFAIHTNDALFISNTSAMSLFVCGRLPATPTQFSLVAGINAIVIPLSIPQVTMASDLGIYLESLDSVYQWDNINQSYNVAYDLGGFWDMDYAIETGFPLLVNSLYALSWPTRSSGTELPEQDK